ncbi:MULTISPECIES: hypothetical protein [Bacillaceae]|uniref:hypothetical protein n=1 Tax=Bacillaceae TaxID=186817 RepID=UPI001C59D81A|nr:hypothetical protein [Rossellomorea sp. YZS02]MBW3113238.1 hypothetical protein [Bacillus sp. MCCB 382]MDX8343839.1 hypothetical protein [Rossellomorea sp. YZS02]
MRHEKPILILTAHFGEGHIQTAETLADTFRKQGNRVYICDLYGEAYPAIQTHNDFLENLWRCLYDKNIRNSLSSKVYSPYYEHTHTFIIDDILQHDRKNEYSLERGM